MTDALPEVARFARWHLDSGDIDPAYPVLRCIADRLGLTPEERTQLVLLYVALYDLGAALDVWSAVGGWPEEGFPRTVKLRTGVERRGNRDPRRLDAHLASLQARSDGHGGFLPWIAGAVSPGDPVGSWRRLSDRLAAVYGNGRWATYKTCETLANVCGVPLSAPDADHASSSGPRKGLGLLYPEATTLVGDRPGTITRLDALTDALAARLSDCLGRRVPVEQVETILCDWHSLVSGHYYVGHDIDQMLEQTRRATPDTTRLIIEARVAAFDARWLGELAGWPGVRRSLLPLYRDTGALEWWT